MSIFIFFRLLEQRRDVDLSTALNALSTVDDARDSFFRPVELRDDHRLVGRAPTSPVCFCASVDNLPSPAMPDASAGLSLLT